MRNTNTYAIAGTFSLQVRLPYNTKKIREGQKHVNQLIEYDGYETMNCVVEMRAFITI